LTTVAESFGRSPKDGTWSTRRVPAWSFLLRRSILFRKSTICVFASSLFRDTLFQSRYVSSSRFTRASSASFSSKHEIGLRSDPAG
jgi:hypothetical protein